ncbi:MAG: DUF899 family protein [Bryobacteraceae bacterium]|jgi:hypothetical protein
MAIRSFLLCLGPAFAATAPAATFPVLNYSTYLRDSFTPAGIATDAAGNIYMTGSVIVDSSTMQTTVLVVKLNPQATQYLYVRYVGGSVNDYGNAIAVDSAGDVYVAGYTNSPDFPVTSGGNFVTAATSSIIERSFVFTVYYNYTETKFPSEEAPGLSVFFKDKTGAVFHTYSTYAGWLDIFLGTYNFLDHTPKGRDEEGLKHTMAWVRHHDKCVDGELVDFAKPYTQPKSISVSEGDTK